MTAHFQIRCFIKYSIRWHLLLQEWHLWYLLHQCEVREIAFELLLLGIDIRITGSKIWLKYIFSETETTYFIQKRERGITEHHMTSCIIQHDRRKTESKICLKSEAMIFNSSSPSNFHIVKLPFAEVQYRPFGYKEALLTVGFDIIINPLRTLILGFSILFPVVSNIT